MGNAAELCSGGNVMQKLIDTYGADAGKFFAAQKGKEAVTQKFSELQTQTKDVFAGFQNQTTGMVAKYNEDLAGTFNGVKAKASSAIPGGIPALEQMKGQSFAEISGFNNLQSELDKVKVSAFEKIGVAKSQALTELDSKKTGIIQNIDDQKPKLPIYDSLPAPIKAKVLTQAEERFGDVIASQKGTLLNQISSQVDISKYTGMFSQLSPDSALKNLVGGASNQLSSCLNLGGIAGGLGGFGKQIGGFF